MESLELIGCLSYTLKRNLKYRQVQVARQWVKEQFGISAGLQGGGGYGQGQEVQTCMPTGLKGGEKGCSERVSMIVVAFTTTYGEEGGQDTTHPDNTILLTHNSCEHINRSHGTRDCD